LGFRYPSALRKRRVGEREQAFWLFLAGAGRRARRSPDRQNIGFDFGVGAIGVGGSGCDMLARPFDKRRRRGVGQVAAQPLIFLDALDHPQLALILAHTSLP
jgi:hypothetical protein